jgi:inhibitor of KinA
MDYRIFPLGGGALTIDFGNSITFELNERVRASAEILNRNQFPGFIEMVPAYSSLTVFYSVIKVKKAFPNFETAFAAVENLIEEIIKREDLFACKSNTRLFKIPVCYEAEFALDTAFIAEHNNLTPQQIIEIHTSRIYRVFMIGFLPGFPYLGELDEKIAAPRKQEPRLRVPQGSVGIAGLQTGIYSLESPGGWQIIGRTPLSLFDPQNKENPVLLQTGDSIQFYAIDKETFMQ